MKSAKSCRSSRYLGAQEGLSFRKVERGKLLQQVFRPSCTAQSRACGCFEVGEDHLTRDVGSDHLGAWKVWCNE